MAQTIDETPHEKRRGTLRNGNPSGDFSTAPRCGARNRHGTPCQCPAMQNRRCRVHGGLSTGPKTSEGVDRIRRAVTKHERYSVKALARRKDYRDLLRDCRTLLESMSRF